VPAWRSLRAPIRVTSVRHDSPTVTTVTVGGRGVRRIAARGGQFFNWRFLDGPGWSRANPYSLSAAPDGRTLRVTVAHVGDGSARVAGLRRGTRVLLEGPYGRMHAGTVTKDKVLLMASGIGITPMRAILDELSTGPGRVTVIHRVRSRDEAVLSDELRELAAARGAHYVLIEGRRIRERDSWLPAQAAHLTDAQALLQVVPDVADRDVLVCGSDGWMDAADRALREAGVPADQVHIERFTY
jgi:ferredoxin-NADP reductase